MWSIVGHPDAVAGLQRSVVENHLAHAYLVTGSPQVGKARLALDLAKAVNCLSTPVPCGTCRACQRIEAGNHPDVEFVGVGGLCDEADHDHGRDGSKDIKICQMRRLQRVVVLRPFEGRSRVVIIDPADAMNVFAADALLKTLEEPPAGVTIVLVSANETALSETVRSRARRLVLGHVAKQTIRSELLERGISPERADLISHLSSGRVGWAFQHATNEALLLERGEQIERIEGLLADRPTERLAQAAELAARFSSGREGVYACLELWQAWCRDLLLVAEGCDDLVANIDRLPALRAMSESLSAAGAVRALEALRDCRKQLEYNANARLALEVMLLRLPRAVRHEEAGPR